MITKGNSFHKGNGLGLHVLDLLKVKQAYHWLLTVAGKERSQKVWQDSQGGHPSLEELGSPLNSLILPTQPSSLCPSFSQHWDMRRCFN